MRVTSFLFLLLLPLTVPAQGPALVDRIVAVVNKEVITFSELNAAVASAGSEKVAVPPSSDSRSIASAE